MLRVHGIQHGAGLEDAEGRDEILDRVREGQGHPLARFDAERRQRVRRPARQPIELRVRDAPVLVQDEGMPAACRDVARQDVEDRVAHYASVPQSATSTVPMIILASSDAR